MKLIIVRHGETIGNLRQINEGHLPGKLTKRGIAQAKKLAEKLKNIKIDVAYSSDLKRAVETAKIIMAKHKGVPVTYTPALRERNFGVFEGTKYGTIRRYVEEKNLDFVTFKPEKGESIDETKKRIIDFFKKIVRRHKDQTVLWVTHGGLIVNLLLYLKKWGDARYKDVLPENAALTIINVNTNGCVDILVENYANH